MRCDSLPALRPPTACGFSLLELSVSVLLVVVATTLALEAMRSTTRVVETATVEERLAEDGDRALAAIRSDLARSGWYLPGFGTGGITSGNDRTLRYWPYIIQQAPAGQPAEPTSTNAVGSGLGTQFALFSRSAAMVRLPAPSAVALGGAVADFDQNYLSAYPGDAVAREQRYRASWYARSQEIVFLRAHLGTWDERARQGVPVIPFAEGDWTTAGNHAALGLLAMDETTRGTTTDQAGDVRLHDPHGYYRLKNGKKVYDVINDSGLLGGSDDPAGMVAVRWEADRETPDVETGSDGLRRITLDQLRQFTYAVVPSPITGNGRLVRAFTVDLTQPPWSTTPPASGTGPGMAIANDGAHALVVDQALSENCQRIVFDTVRSAGDGSLIANQVRVRLYLAGTDPTGQVVTRFLEAVIALRSLNNAAANEDLESVIAVGAAPLPH